ncbi:MAG: molecular chaperone TorD family protein [Deltaproteobacteria bacterium]|nr:molecular chaperone TorD family protein [Deltaproteobacteria bacterium]
MAKSSKIKSEKAILEGIDALCCIFWGPDPDQCRTLLDGDFTAVFENVETELGPVINKDLNKFKSILNKYDDPENFFLVLNEEYVRLFISNPGGVTAPLFESCHEYENAPLMGPAAIRMKDFLESAGLDISEDFNEPPDHLCIELELLYFILEKAWKNKKITRLREVEAFVSKVMLPWIKKFYGKLSAENPDCLYTVSTAILLNLLQSIKRSLAPPMKK